MPKKVRQASLQRAKPGKPPGDIRHFNKEQFESPC